MCGSEVKREDGVLQLKKHNIMKRILAAGLILLLGGSIGLVHKLPDAMASGGSISLSVSDPVKKKGEVFSVICKVTAETGVLETDFYVDYNTSVLKFIDGGAKATKETGGVHILSLDNTDSPVRRTFSLSFLALENGDATVFIRSGARLTDGEGSVLSLKTDKIDITVNETGEEEAVSPGATPPQDMPTETPKLSGNWKVAELVTNAISMTPEFDPTIRTYEAEVGMDTDIFFMDYKLASKKAKAQIKGNRDLTYGLNKVTLTVTAENGDKRRYVFMVTRKTEPDATPATEDVVSGPAADSSEPLDKSEDKGYSIILYIVIVLLSVFSISMVVLVKKQRSELEYYYEEEEREARRETEDDRRSGEGDLERGEIRGEARQFNDRY